MSIASHSDPSSPAGANASPSPWGGSSRPTPDELRSADYDTEDRIVPKRKLLVCAGPRTSSKRLARLLLAAGCGVPMEYFNPNNIRALCTRWGIRRRDYLANVFNRRSVHGVFATNLQHQQFRNWPRPEDFAILFAGAGFIHLTRPDKPRQAASLAACLLTGHYGFEETTDVRTFAPWRMRRAAHQAAAIIMREDRQWADFFTRWRITPLAISQEQVNADDPRLISAITRHFDLPFHADAVELMLKLDRGSYPGDQRLKAELLPFVKTFLGET